MSRTVEELRARIRELARQRLEALREEARAPDFSQRATFSHMVGVYVLANAVPDLRMVVEGPDCTHLKTQYLEGNHDLEANLTSLTGLHRVANTALYPSSLIGSREEPVRELIERLGQAEDTGAVMLAPMPMAAITGADYDRLCVEAEEACGVPCFALRGSPISGDWLDGFDAALLALAEKLPLPGAEADPQKVALVGYLWDRNEQDHHANLALLGRYLEALGLELCSTWPSGVSVEALGAVAEAGTILSLPYGRAAARALRRRLDRPVLELELPFGFDASERFLKAIGAHFGVEEEAAALCEAGYASTVPRLEWLVPLVFQGLRAGYIGDPHLAEGFAEMIHLLGGELAFALISNRQGPREGCDLGVPEGRLLTHPTMRSLRLLEAEVIAEARLHLVVTNLLGGVLESPEPALVELGFPSVYTHALHPTPFLGFEGALAFLERVANRLRMAEVEDARLLAWLRGL
ncbi:MAG: nitrogenase component 1 [Deltaproteobacteria bacterium]|nr:nitrogenase component 1 [Deltaproteobacteria bacterium]